MVTQDTQRIIPLIRDCLAQQPVERAWLFGSRSRGEEQSSSDIDLLVRYLDSDALTLFAIARIGLALEDATHHRIDLVEEGQLLPFAQASAERDKILIYERARQ